MRRSSWIALKTKRLMRVYAPSVNICPRDASQMMGESELWKILSLFLFHEKSFDCQKFLEKFPSKFDVASLSPRSESRRVHLHHCQPCPLLERDVSPAILMEIERQISLGNTIASQIFVIIIISCGT